MLIRDDDTRAREDWELEAEENDPSAWGTYAADDLDNQITVSTEHYAYPAPAPVLESVEQEWLPAPQPADDDTPLFDDNVLGPFHGDGPQPTAPETELTRAEQHEVELDVAHERLHREAAEHYAALAAAEKARAPVAPPEWADLAEKVTWHVRNGVRDLTVLASVCNRDYRAICRAIEVMERQNVVHQVNGGWQASTRR